MSKLLHPEETNMFLRRKLDWRIRIFLGVHKSIPSFRKEKYWREIVHAKIQK
jgi:hypothetical protein